MILPDLTPTEHFQHPLKELGVSTFHFAFYPESEEMMHYNLNSKKFHITHFSSPEMYKAGSALIILNDYLSRIHPGDHQLMSDYITKHYEYATNNRDIRTPIHFKAQQFRVLTPSGQYEWHELRTQLYNEEDGGLVLCEGSFLDISILKSQELKLQAEIKKHEETQQSLLKTLSELRQVQETMLKQEKLKVLGEMVGGVAHDFGNVLLPIQAYSEAIKDELIQWLSESPSEDTQLRLTELSEMNQEVITAATDGREMIDLLRATHRPDDTISLNLKRILLKDFITSVFRMARPRWSGKRPIEFKAFVNTELTLTTYESLLRQALLNLIYNSMDAIAEREDKVNALIQIEAFDNRQGAESMIELRLTDNGVGMSKELVERCMTRFVSTKGERGTGLGLANSSDIISNLGGKLTIQSTLGEGTKALIRFPKLSTKF